MVAGGEGRPPVGHGAVQFAGTGAQQQKIVTGPEAQLGDQRERLTAPFFQPGLHHPDLAHVRLIATLQRQLHPLLVQHAGNGQVQCRYHVFAPGTGGFPAHPHLRPQQGGKQEAGRDRFALLHALVGAGQCLRDEALVGFEDGVEQRQDAVVQPLVPQPLDAGQTVAAFQQFHDLVENPCRRHVLEQRGHPADGLEGGRIDLKIQLGRKAYRAQHPHRILAVAGGRVADHAQQPGVQVLHAAQRVDQRFGNRVVIQRVDREVAAQGIFVAGAEFVVVEHAAVRIGLAVGLRSAEGGDLDGLPAEHHMHDPEAPPDQTRTPKDVQHLFRGGIGGHVEILRFTPQQQVTHAAAHDVGRKARLLQLLAGPQGGKGDPLLRQAQRRGRVTVCIRARCRAFPAAAARWAGGRQGSLSRRTGPGTAGGGSRRTRCRCLAFGGRGAVLAVAVCPRGLAGHPFEESVEHDTF